MSEAYAADKELGLPLYSPTPLGDQWFCHIQVKNNMINIETPSSSLVQAQNTAAHNALCTLLIAGDSHDVIHVGNALGTINFNPGHGQKRPLDTQASTTLTKRQRKALNKALNLTGGNNIPPAKVVKPAAAGNARTRRNRRGKRGDDDVQMETGPTSSNLIPLENSRIGPPVTMEEVVDPLRALKDLQEGIQSLPSSASYFSLLKSKLFILIYKALFSSLALTRCFVRDLPDLKDPHARDPRGTR